LRSDASKNARLRFGCLTYVKSTEKTTTSIKLRLDRFIGGSVSVLPLTAESRLLRLVTRSRQVFTKRMRVGISTGAYELIHPRRLRPPEGP
jgi:hypothetical protein